MITAITVIAITTTITIMDRVGLRPEAPVTVNGGAGSRGSGGLRASPQGAVWQT
jgi:hypothetical protein